MVCQWRRAVFAAFVVAGAAAIGAGFVWLQAEAADPLAVVNRWNASRNAGDIDAAMTVAASEGSILGFPLAVPSQRQMLREVLTSQAVASWIVEDSECVTEGEAVVCRYRQHDEPMRRWDVVLMGTHEYLVQDGKVARLERTHDPAAQEQVYRAVEDFRGWVEQTHPERVDMIWSDPRAAFYSTPAGAEAVLSLLDEYDDFRASSQ